MATKYIVDNVSGQTINGDITINGNLLVTGISTTSIATYKALLTQINPITANNIASFNYQLIIGETYTIDIYESPDDFSNIANVISGVINQSGCTFIATGVTPTLWTNGSQLTSAGNLVVDVVENSLGYDLEWDNFFITGLYYVYPALIGPKYANFPLNKTMVTTQQTIFGVPFTMDFVKYYTQPASLGDLDDVVILYAWDTDTSNGVSGTLYYTPVEIQIKQDLDTTPIVINGIITDSFPFGYVSVDLFCDGNYIEGFVGDSTQVNNISELIIQLNTDNQTNFLGTYSEDGLGGVLLTIPTNKYNRFCPNGTLTFEVYAD